MPQEEEEEALSQVQETAFLNLLITKAFVFTAVNTLQCVCNVNVDPCLNAAPFW